VLTALAPALAGVVDAGGRPGAGEPLPAELAERLVAIGQALGAPRFVPVRADADEVIAIVPSRPLELAVGDAFLALPTVELGFFAARAIDDLRSGTWALSALGAERLNELLLAVGRVLGGVGDGPSSPEGAHLARHLEELPSDPAVRDGIVADARAALASPFDLGRHLAGCEHLANRVALLACGQPLVAIAAVYASARGRRPRTDRPGTDPMLPVLAEARAELVREGSALRELVLFLFSAEYRALVEA
jgi:hypothetical protein